MWLSVFPSLLLAIFILSFLQPPALATKKSYVVYFGTHSHVNDEPTSVDFDNAKQFHYEFLGSFLGSNEKAEGMIFYSYTRHINGFAALLEEKEAAEIAKHPNVVSVFLNNGIKLQTTHSWDFLGLERNRIIPDGSIWKKARFGEDTIIGNIDTGVWPESKSFSDEGMGPVPSKWRGICQPATDNTYSCNRKLIGARYFNKGYAAYAGHLNSTFATVRDHDGHGTHTLSTAAGNFVEGVSVFGNGNGTAKGGAPRARVAAYKVCWPPVDGYQCFMADVLAAFDAAIGDGVHVLSISLGSRPLDFFEDGLSIGTFHAVMKGIVVVCAAGNSGPRPLTVTNVAPWILTVGASTTDRQFTSYVKLPNGKHIRGLSLSSKDLPSKKFYPLISAPDAKAANATANDALCCKPGALERSKVQGKILVCLRTDNKRTERGQLATIAGAVAMILANDEKTRNDVVADAHLLPVSHINFTDGEYVFAYINSTKTPMAYISSVKTKFGEKPAPFVASFSSVGPSIIEQAILKPDIIAPGVSVIAAYSEAVGPTNLLFDKRRIPFNVQTGTSMSCPHVSGVAALLRTIHPDWSPAAIRSAIMTTARNHDDSMEPMLDAAYMKATPFSYGAGEIQPSLAMDPGLVYDLTPEDYLNFLCGHGYNQSRIKLVSNKHHTCPESFSLTDFNYPSVTIPSFQAPITVTRKIKNVGFPGTYRVCVRAPLGVYMSVKPTSLRFGEIGEEKTFKVMFKPKDGVKLRGYVFGELIWTDGKHTVKSPIAMKHKHH